MKDITPLHLQPDAIPEPRKHKPLREPVFRHPLAVAGYLAYDDVQAFGREVRSVIRECRRLGEEAARDSASPFARRFAAQCSIVANEFEAWAREEGLI